MDTRGWKPKDVGNPSEIPGSRTGENRHAVKAAVWNPPQGLSRVDERGVEMDNMGNAHSNHGPELHATREADNVDVAPTVPLSSYEGVNPNGAGGGIALADGFSVTLHERELRPSVSSLAPQSSSVMGSSFEAVNKSNPQWKRAVVPGGSFENITEDKFTGDGTNPRNVEDMSDKTAVREQGQFKGTVSKRQG
jgi:hypothetical protein